MTTPGANVMVTHIYSTRTTEELVETWRKHRNDLAGIMAAEEVMRRLASGRLQLLPLPPVPRKTGDRIGD